MLKAGTLGIKEILNQSDRKHKRQIKIILKGREKSFLPSFKV
jgi:hypothetical protein